VGILDLKPQSALRINVRFKNNPHSKIESIFQKSIAVFTPVRMATAKRKML
jgi:hypothetical protein